ncbi:hypothetical protein GCM10010103_64940 [Streptomyces paradoxus]|uniref:Uncharacterized protein n=1 Tax=Streptomyces paradoxus TaxID=66375 RepID=A0A7W9WKV8_9ACTN|nr:hypothetical protein [Streptomyces paradoxus]MBB6081096.1 hypothetical protein [Streptomyces paradoxus]
MPTPSSAFDLSQIVQITGDASSQVESLTRQLREQGVDPAPAVAGTTNGSRDDAEKVARLIALARGHGLCVELRDGQSVDERFRVVQPATIGLLQSGHHAEIKDQ